MQRILLFSNPVDQILDKILDLIFPDNLANKRFGYIPSDGSNCPKEFVDLWQGYAIGHGYAFEYIDNSKTGNEAEIEVQKLKNCNIALVTGGNTFTLLRNLRRSGLDKALIDFAKQENKVIAGFSAGALVMTPSIAIAGLKGIDTNYVGLTDLKGLNLVDFEVFPHYGPEWKELYDEYQSTTTNEIKRLSDLDYLSIEK